MCLTLDLEATKAWKRKHRGQKFVWRWKAYRGVGSCLYTTYQLLCIKRPGTVRSNRKKQQLGKTEVKRGEVDMGCHVFAKGEEAQIYHRTWGYTTVRVRCQIKDFVATGNFNGFPSEVFMSYEIPKSEWKRVFGRLPK